MATSIVAENIPLAVLDKVLHIFSDDHVLFVTATGSGTLALWVFLCVILWCAADPNANKRADKIKIEGIHHDR